jgi:hypothetical protein
MERHYTAIILPKQILEKKFKETDALNTTQFKAALDALDRDVKSWPLDIKIAWDWERARLLLLNLKQVKALLGAITYAGMEVGTVYGRMDFEDAMRKYGVRITDHFTEPVKTEMQSYGQDIARTAMSVEHPKGMRFSQLREVLEGRSLVPQPKNTPAKVANG